MIIAPDSPEIQATGRQRLEGSRPVGGRAATGMVREGATPDFLA